MLDDGGGLTLIDTLFDTDARRVLALLRRLNRPVTDLRNILLTHGHRSHLGGLAALKRLSGATVYAHQWEADIIAGERKAQPVPITPTRPYLVYLPTYPLQLGAALGKGAHPPCPVDHFISDGDRVGPVDAHGVRHRGTLPESNLWPSRRIFTCEGTARAGGRPV